MLTGTEGQTLPLTTMPHAPIPGSRGLLLEGTFEMRKAFEIGGLIAGLVLVVFGIVVIVMGVNARSTVTSSLSSSRSSAPRI